VQPLDLTLATWRKSSHSNQDGGECVEVSADFPGVVPVRDSKQVNGPVIVFPVADWGSFVSAVQRGELRA
jgi:hypothetical protein